MHIRDTHTHTHPFNGPFSGTARVGRYQKGKTNLDITEARDSEWQWHQLGHVQVCTSLQTDNHARTPPLSFLQARCPSCRPTNSVKALKVKCRLGTRHKNSPQWCYQHCLHIGITGYWIGYYRKEFNVKFHWKLNTFLHFPLHAKFTQTLIHSNSIR